MKCSTANKGIQGLLSQTLKHDETAQLLEHVHNCPECSRDFNAWNEVEDLIRDLQLLLTGEAGTEILDVQRVTGDGHETSR